MTRAKHGLIIIGNIETLYSDPCWKALIDFMSEQDTIVQGFEGARQRIESPPIPIRHGLVVQNNWNYNHEDDFM